MKNPPYYQLRLRLLTILGMIYSGIIVASLVQIQIIDHESYAVKAENQHWQIHPLQSGRGSISSADGFVLATNEVAYQMYAEPKNIESPEKVTDEIIAILGSETFRPYVIGWKNEPTEELQRESTSPERIKNTVREYLITRLSLDLNWVSIANRITEQQKRDLEGKQLVGIGFERQDIRFYPENSIASHIVGFVGADDYGIPKGYFGIEGYFDGDLRGDDGYYAEERTARGEPILIGNYKRVDAISGRDLTLTIDRSIQNIIEANLKRGVEYYDAKSGTAVAIEPATGKIIALANIPDFNPNKPLPELYEYPQKVSDDKNQPYRDSINRRNHAIATTYEPGSVIKPLTISAAIDQELITPQSTFTDNGPLIEGPAVVDNWDKKHHGIISTVDILALSDNVGSAQVGRLLGPLKLHDYFKKFGLGTITGVDLEGESAGVLADPSLWRNIDTMTAAFGQGFTATPLQVASAFSAIANQGILMKPYVVEKSKEKDQESVYLPEEVRRVIKPFTATLMTDMLVRAVEDGESKFYNIRNYKIAGKTGTAQIPEKGKYSPDRTNATFVGFLPNSPKFVLLVRLEEPRRSIYAAETAVPLWMDIVKELVLFYAIPPDKYD